MALPAQIAELQLPRGVYRGEGGRSDVEAERSLSLGVPALDAVLPGGGLQRGSVVELAVCGGSALATTLALSAIRAVQHEGRLRGGEAPWCAFVDPGGTLFGPAVARAGVELSRLLVVRPSLEALARTTLRVVESRAFAVVVIDTAGTIGQELEIALGSWPRVVRRLAIAAEGSSGAVVLITDKDARRPLPLPVAQRIELGRPSESELSVRIAKDRRGRVSGPRTVRFNRPELYGGEHERRAG